MNWKNLVTVRFLAVFLAVLFALGISGMALAATDVALGGTATQSSTYVYSGVPRVAQLAIDGNTDGNFYDGSVSHTTNTDPQEWWQVDLGNDYRIDSIVLWNRTDTPPAGPERLTNFKVSVLDAGNNTVWSQDYFTAGGYPNPSLSISLPSNTYGRYVKVSLNAQNYLSLAEVQVFGIAQSAVPAMTWWGLMLLGLAGLAVIMLYSKKKRRA
jgi:NedA-like, galactose-binding domain